MHDLLDRARRTFRREDLVAAQSILQAVLLTVRCWQLPVNWPLGH